MGALCTEEVLSRLVFNLRICGKNDVFVIWVSGEGRAHVDDDGASLGPGRFIVFTFDNADSCADARSKVVHTRL